MEDVGERCACGWCASTYGTWSMTGESLCPLRACMPSAWNKMDAYRGMHFDAEGGDSAPILVTPPFTPMSLVDGLIYFLPTEEQVAENGQTCAIDVSIALSEPLWSLLDNDPLFRQFSSA